MIGCHGLVWTGSYDAAGIEYAVSKTAEAGFDLIEFPLMNPFAFDAKVARKALDDNGIAASGSLGLSAATDVSSEDDSAVRAGRELLFRAVDVLAELGAKHLCGIIYSAMQKYVEPATEKGLANSRSVIAEVAERARQADVSVSLEVTNRYESNVLNTARQAREFVRAIGHPNLGVHLDTYHMNIEETDLFSPVIDTEEQLRYVHVGESHRGYLGTGSVDFDSVFKALGRIDYDGPIVFESFSSAVVSPELTRTLGIWRNLWTDSDELARHANAFIRDKLTAVRSIRHH